MKWNETIKTLEEYKNYLEKEAKDNMGRDWRLRKDIVFNLQVNDDVFEITFKAKSYWIFAERGRRPGKFPPPKAIDAWITRRRIVPYPLPSGRVPTRPQLVYLISRKIARDGTEGKHFLHTSITKDENLWEDRIKDALTTDIENELSEWLSPLSGVTSI